MDYKKIITNKENRLKFLKLLDFLPDKLMLYVQYKFKTGRRLNLENPIRYTEKLQWYKLYYKDALLTQCSDKYEVRDYVKNKNLGHILNEIYGVYENVKDIDFEDLPNTFAIKVTNGSGTNILVENKKSVDITKIKEKLNEWMNIKNTSYGREWSYYDIKPKIIIEKMLERDKKNDLPDYKFFCFNGEVDCLYTMIDYVDDHENGKCSFYDTHFQKLPYKRSEYDEIDIKLDKPKNFENMLNIASKLSEDFPHVRVDLYNIDGKIIFGELTFYNASGYTNFYPDEFDYILGEKFKLPINV